jgi:hypothetical protein
LNLIGSSSSNPLYFELSSNSPLPITSTITTYVVSPPTPDPSAPLAPASFVASPVALTRSFSYPAMSDLLEVHYMGSTTRLRKVPDVSRVRRSPPPSPPPPPTLAPWAVPAIPIGGAWTTSTMTSPQDDQPGRPPKLG